MKTLMDLPVLAAVLFAGGLFIIYPLCSAQPCELVKWMRTGLGGTHLTADSL